MTQKNAWFFWIAMVFLIVISALICSPILNLAIISLGWLVGIKIKYSYVSGLIISIFFITLAFIFIYRRITRSDIAAADMHSTISVKVMLIYLYFIGTFPAIGTIERGYGFSSEGLGLALTFPFIIIPFYCVLCCLTLFFLCESVKNKNWRKSLFYCAAAILPLVYYFLLKLNLNFLYLPPVLAILYFFLKRPKIEKKLILSIFFSFYCLFFFYLMLSEGRIISLSNLLDSADFFRFTSPFVFSISLIINFIFQSIRNRKH